MYNGALLSGFMSGSCAYIPKRKYYLVWPKGEEKQDKDDYTCQGPCNGLSGGCLRWCEWQLGHDVKTSESFIYIHMYIHKESQTADQKSKLQTFVVSLKVDITNFCSLKKRTYQDTTKFCSLKDPEYYMPEKQTTNFCNLKDSKSGPYQVL